jgi:hypothetical protein
MADCVGKSLLLSSQEPSESFEAGSSRSSSGVDKVRVVLPACRVESGVLRDRMETAAMMANQCSSATIVKTTTSI